MVRSRSALALLLSLTLAFGGLLGAPAAWAEPATGGSQVERTAPPDGAAEPSDGAATVPLADLLAEEAPPAVDEADEGELYAEGEVLVALSPDAATENIEESLADAGVAPIEPLESAAVAAQDLVTVAVEDGASVSQKIDELMASEEVLYAQPNYLYALEYEPNDPVFQGSMAKWWHLDDIGIFRAWDIAKVGKTVRVATIDSGVRTDHEDLKANLDLASAYNTYTGESGASAAEDKSANGHGTHVAGLVAAEADNGIGVAGSSFNAEVIPVNVIHTGGPYAGKSTTADMVEALSYIMEFNKREQNDIRVVNISMGGYAYDPALASSVSVATGRDIVIVAAGGNEGKTAQGAQPSYPSDLPDVVSVTWYNSLGERDSRSDYGSGKTIAAPGTSIYSTLNSSAVAYGTLSGSSMASPVVAGVCALMFSANPDLSGAELRQALYDTAVDAGSPGWDPYYGYGKIDAFGAVMKVLSAEPEEPSPSPLTSSELSGSDRIATSVAIAKETYPNGPSGIIVVRSDDFPDALAASALSGALGYPIVMSDSGSLSPAISQYIRETGSLERAILIGDRYSLSARVQSSIAGLGLSYLRIGGSNRFETAGMLREAADSAASADATAIVARSDNYPDALSISPYCATSRAGLFLIDPGSAPSSAMVSELKQYKRVVIVGSTASVSGRVESSLRGSSVEVLRLAGGGSSGYSDDRYGTSAAIADWIVSRSGKAFSFDDAAFATGSKFPDALAGGPLCASKRSVLLLVDPGSYSAVDVAASSKQVKHVYWLGSTDTLSSSLRSTVLSRLG